MFCALMAKTSAGQIIDVHMHSYTEKNFWVGTARNGFASSKTARETLEETIKKMNQHNIKFAVVSGPMESLEIYTKADKRFIPGYQDLEENLIPIEHLKNT